MFSVKRVSYICLTIVRVCFLLLFFITPLIFTPINSELFELNKMLAVYSLTIIIAAAWGTRMIVEQRIIFRRTFWDMPLLLFFIAMSFSTIFSRDIYMSIFGYYSRFHQGLLSIISFLILYWSFVSNIYSENSENSDNQIARRPDSASLNIRFSDQSDSLSYPSFPKDSYTTYLIFTIILSSLIVAAYGIAQHFGLDFFHWVQDVKFRVFSSLGQPNWLGAYLAVILLITAGFHFSFLCQNNFPPNFKFLSLNFKLNSKFQILNSKFLFYFSYFIFYLFLYTALLFTRSRSAFSAFHICFGIFTAICILKKRALWKTFFIFYFLFFILINVFNIFPTPFEKINELTIPNLIQKISEKVNNTNRRAIALSESRAKSRDESKGEGGTESFAIRKIVWRGALNAFAANPILGTGLETFALAYYQYKPLEQNMVSEWDFLYNKSHNEYLNYLATTGAVGFISYLILIGFFIYYFIRVFVGTDPPPAMPCACSQRFACDSGRGNAWRAGRVRPLQLGLFLAWLTILITNFVGFSVVAISLFFYLIPAIIFILNETSKKNGKTSVLSNRTIEQSDNTPHFKIYDLRFSAPLILIIIFTIYALRFTGSFWLADFYFARQEYQTAIDLASYHPTYHNEFAVSLSGLVPEYLKDGKKDIAEFFAERSIEESDIAIQISPQSPIFYSYRAIMFHNLAELDKKYEKHAIESILKAKKLAPRDPKVVYHAAIYFLNDGQIKKALTAFSQMEKLKPNYSEGMMTYAQVLNDINRPKEASYVLKKIKSYNK